MRRLPSRPTRIGALAGVLASLLLAPGAAFSDVSIQDQGRQTRTGPKQIQREYNGIQLDPSPRDVAPRPSGRTLTAAGRALRSEPTQRVSVGIIGCPGCQEALREMGGVVVDARRPRR